MVSYYIFIVLVFLLFTCEGNKVGSTKGNPATAPPEASSVTGSPTDNSVRVSWTAPTLDNNHKTADTSPLAVAKGTTSINITNLTTTTTYEVVVQAVNATDTTKVSTGIKTEVTTLSSLNLVLKKGSTIETEVNIRINSVGVNVRSIVTPNVSGTFFISPNLTKNTGILFNTNTGILSGLVHLSSILLY